jgi:hypothetical protein
MSRDPKRLLLALAVVGASLSLPFACSSSSSVSAQQACTDVAAARCQKLQQCAPHRLVTTYGDLATCETRQAATCVSNLAAPQNANTAARTEACAQAVPGESCDDFELGNVPADCSPVVGPRDAGSACAVSSQCATAYCLIPNTSSCGACAATPGVGTSCANNACGPGLVCNALSLECVTPVGASGSCNDSSACGPGLTCIGNTGTTLGTCRPLASTVGASCSLADGGSRCDARTGLYCNAVEGRVCELAATASANQECGNIDGGAVDCTANSFCQRTSGSSTGTCIPPAVDGTACDTSNGPVCATPSRCVLSSATTGICQTTNPATCN